MKIYINNNYEIKAINQSEDNSSDAWCGLTPYPSTTFKGFRP